MGLFWISGEGKMKDTSVIKRKEITVFILIVILVFAGCGMEQNGENSREDLRMTVEEDADKEMGAGRNAEWEIAPLLTVENPEDENLADLLQKAASGAMVQIYVGKVTGSGVLWQVSDGKLYIATAGHVLESGSNAKERIEIRFADGETATASEYRLSENADLAFVAVDCSDFSEERIQKYCLVNTDKKSFDELEAGDGIILMASARGVGEDAYEGSMVETWVYLEDFEQYMMRIRVYAYAGMSGGGVFDQKGHFIGIFCGESSDMDGAAVPLGIIQTKFAELLDGEF